MFFSSGFRCLRKKKNERHERKMAPVRVELSLMKPTKRRLSAHLSLYLSIRKSAPPTCVEIATAGDEWDDRYCSTQSSLQKTSFSPCSRKTKPERPGLKIPDAKQSTLRDKVICILWACEKESAGIVSEFGINWKPVRSQKGTVTVCILYVASGKK